MEFHDYPIIILFIICVLIVIGYYMAKCCKTRLNEFSFAQFFGKKNMPLTQPLPVADPEYPESELPSTSAVYSPNVFHSSDANDEFGNSVRSRATVGIENNGYIVDSNELNDENSARKRIESKESNSTTESVKQARYSQIRETLIVAGVREAPRSRTQQCLRDPENNFTGPYPTASSSLDNEHHLSGQIINISIPRFDSYSNGLRPGLNGIRPTQNGPLLNRLGLRLSGLGWGQQPVLNNSGSESTNNAPSFVSMPALNEINIEGENNGGASNGGASNGGASNGGASNGGASNGGASNGGASNGGASNGGASHIDGSSFTDSTNAYTASSSPLSTYAIDADSCSTDSVFY